MGADRKFLQVLVLFLVMLLGFNATHAAGAKPAAGGVDTILQKIRFGEPADVFLGKAGVYFIESAYTAKVEFTRLDPVTRLADRDLNFLRRWVDVRVVDSQGKELKQVFGLIYVYFNLDSTLFNAYEDGDLKIYHYDEEEKAWSACPVLVEIDTKNLPYGRLACVISDFGLYGLAIER